MLSLIIQKGGSVDPPPILIKYVLRESSHLHRHNICEVVTVQCLQGGGGGYILNNIVCKRYKVRVCFIHHYRLHASAK